MDEPGPMALTFTRGRGHPRGMAARRRAGAYAIAAALIGAGLVLQRPRRMPELRVGSRSTPPQYSSLAAAIVWPPAPGLASATPGSITEKRPPKADGAAAAWRDALADRPFMAASLAAPASYVSSAAARHHRAPYSSASAAKTPRIPAAAFSAFQAASRRMKELPGPSRPGNPSADRARAVVLRVPLARGPASADDAGGEDHDGVSAVDPRPKDPNAAAEMRRRTRSFPLFRPPRRATRKSKSATARRRVRPLLLSKLLGRDALRPPSSSIVPPDLSGLQGRKPLLLPDGASVPTRTYELDRIEASDPRRAQAACRRRAPHWDIGPRWHDGAAHGLIADARWLWLWKEQTRWWAVPEAEFKAALLRHRGLWWSKQRGVWFALHDGELWTWRRFSRWDAEGLLRLADGVELVYSADFAKVAVITPGEGAVLYDAATGAELGEWLEGELPRRRPRVSAELRLPSGI